MTTPLSRAVQTLKSGFALLGFAATVAGVLEYKRLYPQLDDDDTKKKNRALVIPFHRLNIVERNEKDFRDRISELNSSSDDPNKVTTMELRELVELLHHAASDPTITSIYGIFGHGGQGVDATGWAQLEEIRNALQVVKESHRRHPEPNTTHQEQPTSPLVPSKPLYAYSDSFASLASPSNRDYYLASVFTHIHMQEKGELNLFGSISQHFFVRDLLERYGIQLHVFKHGNYKNAPNMFTHMTYNKHHYENVANIQKSIEADVCNEITDSRSNKLLTSWLTKKHKQDDNVATWKRINAVGAFPGDAAVHAGFIDSLPRRDPLSDLVNKEMGDKEKNDVSSKWNPHETDFASFPSDSSISLKQYAKQVTAKKKAAERKQYIEGVIAKSTYLKQILSVATGNKKFLTGNSSEQIALIYVDGMIGNEMAGTLVDSIRKIRKDDKTKCLVLRVASGGGSVVACETIQQELKALDIPVVFSFGNVSASGGYYIASFADRIFGSKKTITGSIGVFGIRPDFTGLAAKYGVNVDHVASGELSGINMPFYPMSLKMKKQIAKTIDRHYSDFKDIVSNGRGIPVDSVEAIAQGRVWTGIQGKENGLIDEIGGLHRAIAYARRTYISNKLSDGTDVVVWPKKTSVLQKLLDRGSGGNAFTILGLLSNLVGGETDTHGQGSTTCTSIPPSLSGVFMVTNEDLAIRCLMEDANINPPDGMYNFPDSFWQ